MKKAIHPKYKEITITCGGCGTVIKTRSTRDSYKVDVCSNCHPFYTGRQKYVDSAGRVERFQRKWIAAKMKREEAEKQKKKGEGETQAAGNAAGTSSPSQDVPPVGTKTEPAPGPDAGKP